VESGTEAFIFGRNFRRSKVRNTAVIEAVNKDNAG
jgi:hypothetical protein